MDRTISATVDASPQATMQALADLSTYPSWLTLVTAAEPDTEQDTWIVTLRARLGPLARSKRLRMVRTELDATHVRFERAEVDGRVHATWVLDADISEVTEQRCTVHVKLHYGGALWSAPLELVLATFEGSAADRLGAYLAETK